MNQLDMFSQSEVEYHNEHILNEVIMSLYHATKMCPSGMLVVGYDPTVYCERCEIVEGSFAIRFQLQILWNGKHTHYINLCDCCLDIVVDCEREFQEKNRESFSAHVVE